MGNPSTSTKVVYAFEFLKMRCLHYRHNQNLSIQMKFETCSFPLSKIQPLGSISKKGFHRVTLHETLKASRRFFSNRPE